ncbi:copper transporter 2-like [Carex rostrata]
MVPHYIYLFVAFLLSASVEWLSRCRSFHTSWISNIDGLKITTIHAARVGLTYLLMLSVMSFDIVVLVAVVLGHAVGFFLFARPGIVQETGVGDMVKVDLSTSMPC